MIDLMELATGKNRSDVRKEMDLVLGLESKIAKVLKILFCFVLFCFVLFCSCCFVLLRYVATLESSFIYIKLH